MSTCAACGIDNAPGAKFCKQCGEAMAVLCPTCNTENATQAKYCKSCAGPLQKVGSASVSSPPKPISAPVSYVRSKAAVNPAPSPSAIPSGGTSTKAASDQGTLANALIVAIVLIVGYFYMSSGKNNAEPVVPAKDPAPSVDAKARDQSKGSAKVRVASEAEGKALDNQKSRLSVTSSYDVPGRVATAGNTEPAASQDAGALITQMLEASAQNAASEITELKTRIEALPKSPKGDRKVARGLNYEAIVLLRDNKFTEAAAILEKAAAADPADVEIADNLGFAALKGGNLDAAKRSSYAALTLSPGRSSAWASLGVVLAQTETEEQAVAAFTNAYRFSGNTSKTIEYLEKLAAEDPSSKVKSAATKALEVVKTFQ